MRVRNLTAVAARAAACIGSVSAIAVVPVNAQDATQGREVEITIENLTTGQNFSPSFFVSRSADTAPLFALGETASEPLVSVAEGGNIGGFSGQAARDMGTTYSDAVLAIHTLPGQTRTVTIQLDQAHPVIDGVWMLGMTNDGFSGITGFNAFEITEPTTVELSGYDAGSEVNNEKKGFLGALGEGNMRDPEDGVITHHTGIRGNADAPAEWQFDPDKPVATITVRPAPMAGG